MANVGKSQGCGSGGEGSMDNCIIMDNRRSLPLCQCGSYAHIYSCVSTPSFMNETEVEDWGTKTHMLTHCSIIL